MLHIHEVEVHTYSPTWKHVEIIMVIIGVVITSILIFKRSRYGARSCMSPEHGFYSVHGTPDTEKALAQGKACIKNFFIYNPPPSTHTLSLISLSLSLSSLPCPPALFLSLCAFVSLNPELSKRVQDAGWRCVRRLMP
jgi:hypothetical protein